MIACRKQFTDTLLELAREDKDIIAVTTDARGSVTLGDFANELPEQFVECGIAEQNADTAVIAADAAADIFEANFFGFVGHIRIAERGAAHGNKIRFSRSKNFVCEEGIVHAGNRDHRNLDDIPDLLGPIGEPAVSAVAGGNIQVNREIVADGDVDQVESGLLHHDRDCLTIFNRKTACRHTLKSIHYNNVFTYLNFIC